MGIQSIFSLLYLHLDFSKGIELNFSLLHPLFYYPRVYRIIFLFHTLCSAFIWVWRTISYLYTLLIYGNRTLEPGQFQLSNSLKMIFSCKRFIIKLLQCINNLQHTPSQINSYFVCNLKAPTGFPVGAFYVVAFV